MTNTAHIDKSNSSEIEQLKSQLASAEKTIKILNEEIERLRRGLVGPKKERFSTNENQLTIPLLEMLLADQETASKVEVDKQVIPAHKRKKPTGRKPLPDDLPVVRFEFIPDEVKQKGIDNFICIGEEISRVLERRPSSMVIVETVRKKFKLKEAAPKESTEILITEVPEKPILKGVAGPGMLADTIVKRFEDHLPLNRLEKVYGREGIELARSSICNWHEQLSNLVQPLIDAMFEDAKRAHYLCVDATGVLVQAPKECKKSQFWVMVAPDQHVLFRYSEQHDSKAVDTLLGGYSGYLVADAHTVYDHLFKPGDIIEAGCWSHCRRYFYKAIKTDPERATQALALIRQLFLVERTLANSPRKKREQVRKEKSKPIYDKFFTWCDQHKEQVLDETPISKAINYARNQQKALGQFLYQWRLPIDNNISERHLRRQAIGRKNWLFVGSKDGATVNTNFVSLLASCQMHKIEPWSYLRDLFCLLPGWPIKDVLQLAPAYWQDTSQLEHVKSDLDNNIFRQATLIKNQ